jgi:hypothetical protein
MGSITQIYSATQGKTQKNTCKTLAVDASLSTTHVYQYYQKKVVNAALDTKK